MSKKEHNTAEAEEKLEQDVEHPVEQAEELVEEQAAEAAEATEADKVQELGEKLAALNDKYLRLYSEYENYRKRTNQEKADLLLNGSREMMKILEQKGLKAMDVKGEKFDENLHEAITRIPAAAEEQKGTVVDVVEKGYYLNDKVLRYAKVVVAF